MKSDNNDNNDNKEYLQNAENPQNTQGAQEAQGAKDAQEVQSVQEAQDAQDMQGAQCVQDANADKKGRKWLFCGLMVLYVVILFLLFGLFFAVQWLLNGWASLSYDELIYHIKAPLAGANPEMVVTALLKYALPVVVLTAAAVVMLVLLRRRKKVRRIVMAVVMGVALIMAGYAAFHMDHETGFFRGFLGEIAQTGKSDFIEEHYVDPGDVDLHFPEKKRNLVYIYLESMEKTFADPGSGGAFPNNLIPHLTALSRENEDFSGGDGMLNGAISLPGTDWTMGGMFAQTAGIPLKIGLNGNAMEKSESFFPTIVTLGDILHANGYRQVLAIGSDAIFGGRDIYFSSHGEYEIHDYNYDVQEHRIAEDYYVWWGIEDEKLYDYAREEVLELAASGEPFNYTMLTVDTHFDDGYLCRLCEDTYGADQYANVIVCADRQAASFVQWLMEQDFYEDTTIILCGDHPTMDSDFCDNVPQEYQRKTYTVIINGAADGGDGGEVADAGDDGEVADAGDGGEVADAGDGGDGTAESAGTAENIGTAGGAGTAEKVTGTAEKVTGTAEDAGTAEGAVAKDAAGTEEDAGTAESAGREYATIDLFPTTLAALGVEIPGQRLGLGVNLYSGEKTLLEEYGLRRCAEEFQRSSPFLEDLSGLIIDEKTLDRERDKVVLELGDYDGSNVVGYLSNVLWMNADAVKELKAVVHDTTDDKTYELPVEIMRTENDPNGWWGTFVAPVPPDHIDALEVTITVSIADVKDYVLVVRDART